MTIAATQFSRMSETFLAAVALTAFSDFLLFDGYLGLSLVLLGLAGALAALAINRSCGAVQLLSGAGCYALALLPILENISLLSMCVFVSLSALGTLIISDELRVSTSDILARMARFFLTLPLRSMMDIVRWRRLAQTAAAPVLRFARIGVWIMPLVIGLAFLALFEDANPVIAAFIAKIDLWYLLRFLDIGRIVFWVALFIVIWPFLRARLPVRKLRSKTEPKPEVPARNEAADTLENILFGEAAILRSLLVFNGLFALQSGLDATYLIGGVALPEGMTYAAYAHRGAYPLIITALLAAAFVLIALREGSSARDSVLIRTLVYVWVAQNILLVLSSILRLDLYVGVYGLTYWRVAAFIWMGMVAIGLLTIIWRIWSVKGAQWLFTVNFTASAIVLYAACFFNFGSFIAHANVNLGKNDHWYTASIGTPALPAMDRMIEAGDNSPIFYYWTSGEGSSVTKVQWRALTANRFLNDYKQWRSWTLRNWRLKRYLDQNPEKVSEPLPKGPQTRQSEGGDRWHR